MSHTLTENTTIDDVLFPYEQVVELLPDSSKAWFNLGVACLHLGRRDRAITAWQETLRLEPDHLQARFNLEMAQLVATTSYPPAEIIPAMPPASDAFESESVQVEESMPPASDAPAPDAVEPAPPCEEDAPFLAEMETPPAFSMQYVVSAVQVGSRSYLESLAAEDTDNTVAGAHHAVAEAEVNQDNSESDDANDAVLGLPARPAPITPSPSVAHDAESAPLLDWAAALPTAPQQPDDAALPPQIPLSLFNNPSAPDVRAIAEQVIQRAEKGREEARAVTEPVVAPSPARRVPRVDSEKRVPRVDSEKIVQQHEALRQLYERRERVRRMIPLVALGAGGIIAIIVFAVIPRVTGAKRSEAPPYSGGSPPAAVSSISSPEPAASSPVSIPTAAPDATATSGETDLSGLPDSASAAPGKADSGATSAPTKPRSAKPMPLAVVRKTAKPASVRSHQPTARRAASRTRQPENNHVRRRTSPIVLAPHAATITRKKAVALQSLRRSKPRASHNGASIINNRTDASDWSPTRPE